MVFVDLNNADILKILCSKFCRSLTHIIVLSVPLWSTMAHPLIGVDEVDVAQDIGVMTEHQMEIGRLCNPIGEVQVSDADAPPDGVIGRVVERVLNIDPRPLSPTGQARVLAPLGLDQEPANGYNDGGQPSSCLAPPQISGLGGDQVPQEIVDPMSDGDQNRVEQGKAELFVEEIAKLKLLEKIKAALQFGLGEGVEKPGTMEVVRKIFNKEHFPRVLDQCFD